MKKCPFCRSEIQDQARFCLFCMKPLTDKESIDPIKPKKRLYFAVAVSIVLLLAAFLILWMLAQPEAPDTELPSQDGSTTLQVPSQAAPGQEETEPSSPPETTDPADPSQIPSAPISSKPAQDPEPSKPEPTPEPETIMPTESEPTPPTESEPEPTDPPTAPSVSTYRYRAAARGDSYYANYENSGNDIVITGVENQIAGGIYRIPSEIDGKRVIAVMANAFTGSNAKVIYLPSTVKTVWNYAFAGCSVTDVYFTHNVHIESFAFPTNEETMIIHCPRNCHDLNYWYFSTNADSYGAVWEEWNG